MTIYMMLNTKPSLIELSIIIEDYYNTINIRRGNNFRKYCLFTASVFKIVQISELPWIIFELLLHVAMFQDILINL